MPGAIADELAAWYDRLCERTGIAAVPVATGSDGAASLAIVRGARIPDSWIEKEPPARFIKISSRPLPVPIQIGAFLKATVVA